MSADDTLQRFVIEDTLIRGEVVHLTNSFATVIEQHVYPLSIRHHLGEALVAATLLAAMLKLKGQVTLQYQSEGPVRILVAKCTHDFHIRGLAQWDHEALAGNLETALREGQLVITIDPEHGERYQGIVEHPGESLAEALNHYFSASEQTPTKIRFAVDKTGATGILLQALPDPEHPLTHTPEQFSEFAKRLDAHCDQTNIVQEDTTDLLKTLFPDVDVRLFRPTPIQFRCNCSPENMRNAILTLGYEESVKLLTERATIEVTCEYCNQSYDYSRDEIEAIFAKNGGNGS